MARLVAHLVLVAWIGTPAGFAQVVPATPKKFVMRPITGNTSIGGVTVEPPKTPPKARYITYLVLAESRQWTSADGKIRVGKLIAFEDLVVETPQGAAQPPAPVPPPHPTVARDGKARLLINNKPCEVMLERLSQADRDFIEQVRASRAKPATAPGP